MILFDATSGFVIIRSKLSTWRSCNRQALHVNILCHLFCTKAVAFTVCPRGRKSARPGPFLSWKLVAVIFYIDGVDLFFSADNECVRHHWVYSDMYGEILMFYLLTQSNPESCWSFYLFNAWGMLATQFCCDHISVFLAHSLWYPILSVTVS